MSTATVNSIIARCIVEPPFLAALASNPKETLDRYDLDEQARLDFLSLDLTRIQYLAGFITKIQNHDVVAELPQTHILLRHYALELPVFSAYHETHQRLRRTNPGKNEKLRVFVPFLKGYLDSLRAASAPGLADILNHEWLLWEVRESVARQRSAGEGSSAVPAPASGAGLDESVPRLNGVFRVGLFEYNPIEIAAEIASSSFDAGRLSQEACMWGYWADPGTASLRLFQLESGVLMVLDQITGSRSISEIIRRLEETSQGEITPEEIRAFFLTAFQSGLCITG
jgi:hypothetical protein